MGDSLSHLDDLLLHIASLHGPTEFYSNYSKPPCSEWAYYGTELQIAKDMRN